MSLFSKLTKNHVDKGSAYPWSQRKLGGASSLLPRHGHAATALPLEESILIFGGIHSKPKKDLFFIDTSKDYLSDMFAAFHVRSFSFNV